MHLVNPLRCRLFESARNRETVEISKASTFLLLGKYDLSSLRRFYYYFVFKYTLRIFKNSATIELDSVRLKRVPCFVR